MITKSDKELIKIAEEVVNNNYDGVRYNHTVGAALLCKSGKIYTGINVYAIHGSCAEFIAMGSAIANGERQFDTIVAVMGPESSNILASPCGNCRQMLSEYAPGINVILSDEGGTIIKKKIEELLPHGYATPRE